MGEIIDYIENKTNDYLLSFPKEQRKNKGQFFTYKSLAAFMASLFSYESLNKKNTVHILDPGSGTGMLSGAVIEQLIKRGINNIDLTCYENDSNVLSTLRSNLNHIKNTYKINFKFHIKKVNYITTQGKNFEKNKAKQQYDLIISNPPYLKISKDSEEAKSMPSIIHGSPNLYFMFAAMSLFNLKENCELVYIIPRSWTSGAYFSKFRDYILNNGKITDIHLFNSRDSVFKNDHILQETIIIKIKKTNKKIKNINISSCDNYLFNDVIKIKTNYDLIINKNNYILLPTTIDDISIINKIGKYNNTLPSLGMKMKTGIVVDFREKDKLSSKESGSYPLFHSQHIQNGKVIHSISGKEFDWIKKTSTNLLQENKDYIMCKRFTAKEEKRRIQCGIYLKEDFKKYKKIATQNKINFIERIDKNEIDKSILYGIYAILNSSLFDQYYRILNGSTQVNSTEINNMYFPTIDIVREIGDKIIKNGKIDTDYCDSIVEAFYE